MRVYSRCARSEHHLQAAWVGNMRALIGVSPRPNFGVFQRIMNSVFRSKKAAFVRLEVWSRLLTTDFWLYKEKEGIALPDASSEVMRIICSLRDGGPQLSVHVWNEDETEFKAIHVGLCDESVEHVSSLIKEGKKLEIQGGAISGASPLFYSHSVLVGQRWDHAKGLQPCTSPHI